MNNDIKNKIIELYYSVFNTCIVFDESLNISSPEHELYFKTYEEMFLFMLDEIQLSIENNLY